MTSSGALVSAKAVKPRRSRKTAAISRRWLLSGSSVVPGEDQVDEMGAGGSA